MNARFLLLLLVALSSIACEQVRPWQRTHLAHPTMSIEDPRGPAEAHVHAIQEGAAGGEGGSGAGCGCN
jgi:hypothetical protein